MYPQDLAIAGIDSLMRARSVAVLGASTRRDALGNQAIHRLEQSGFDGAIHVIHPSGEQIGGRPAITSPRDLPGGVDAAIVSLPKGAVVPALEELADAGVRAAMVPTVGMTADQLRDLRRIVEGRRIVVHGPNCMGLINNTDRVPLWPTHASEVFG